MTSRGLLARGLLVTALLLGCGDDERSPAPPVDSGVRRDAGRVDGGPDVDAGTDLDGGPVADGSAADGGGVPTCTFAFDEEMHVFPISTDSVARARTIPVASGTSGFAVVWSETNLGIPNIYGRLVMPDGRPAPRRQLTDDTSLSREPTILAVGTEFVAAWVDNSMGGYEVWSRALSADLMPTGSASRLTENDDRDDSPVLTTLGSELLAVWVFDDSGASTRVARSRRLTVAGAPASAAVDLTTPPQAPTAPVLGPRSGGAALVWAEGVLDDSDVLLQPLDGSGAPAGDAVALNTENNAAGSVDAALTETGGAVAFDVRVSGVRPEVRFQGVDGAGARSGEERILTVAPESGSGGSIAAFRGGYVVTYRALSDEGLDEPTLRLALVDASGNIVERYDLTTVAADGGRTTVRVSPDGNAVFVAWADLAGSGTAIRAARIPCE